MAVLPDNMWLMKEEVCEAKGQRLLILLDNAALSYIRTIQKPVNGLVEQTSLLGSICGKHWSLNGWFLS